MLTINSNWKAAFSQAGVQPIVHVRVLNIKTENRYANTTENSKTIRIVTEGSANTVGLSEGMTVSGIGIPANTYIESIQGPTTYQDSTDVTLSNVANSTATSVVCSFGKVYQMCTSNANHSITSDRNFADPVVLRIIPVSSTLDAWSREPGIDELNIDCLDEGLVRLLGTSAFGLGILRNRTVEVRLGSPELDFDDYEMVFKGEVTELRPSNGIISLTVRSLFRKVIRGSVRKPWSNEHPLTVIKNALIDSEASGITLADIDVDSFDPEHSDNTDIRHYCITSMVSFSKDVTRSNVVGYALGEKEYKSLKTEGGEALFPHTSGKLSVPLANIVNELAKSMYGSVYVDERGTFRFLRYKPSNSVARHFTVDDYAGFQQSNNHSDVVNKIPFEVGFGDIEGEFTMANTNSQTAYGIQEKSADKMQYSATYTYAYLAGGDDKFDDNDTEISVFSGQTNGLCGTRDLLNVNGPSFGLVGDQNPLYLLNGTEIMKSTSVDRVSSTQGARRTYTPVFDESGTQTANTTFIPGVDFAHVSDLVRSIGGTVKRTINLNNTVLLHDAEAQEFESLQAPDWPNKPLWDITMLYDWGNKLLQRFQDGLPTIEFTVPLSHYDLELGDFISIDTDDFIHRSKSGLNSGTKFEIIGKEASFYEDSVGIKLTCAYVNETAINQSLSIIPKPFARPTKNPFGNSNWGDIQNANVLIGGMRVIPGVGTGNERNITIDPGHFKVSNRAVQNQYAIPIDDLSLDRDTYIGIGEDGNPITSEAATDDEMPPFAPGEIRLAKIITDGTGITSVVDLRDISQMVTRAKDLGITPNGDFSTWSYGPTHPPDGWFYNRTSGNFSDQWVQSLDQTSSGRYTLKHIGGSTTSTKASIVSALFPLQGGVNHSFSVKARSPLGESKFTCAIEEFTETDGSAGNTPIEVVGKAGPVSVGAADTWETHSDDFTPNAATKYGRVVIERPQSSTVETNDIYFDAVTVDSATPSNLLSPFDLAGTAVKRIPVAGVTTGTEGSSLREWVEEMFFPFLSAQLSFNTPGKQEKGLSSNSITFNGNVTVRDETSFTANSFLFKDITGEVIFPLTLPSSTPNVQSWSKTISSSTSASVLSGGNNYTIEIGVGDNGTPTTLGPLSRTPLFYAPTFFTTGAVGLTTAQIQAGTKVINTSMVSRTEQFTYSNAYIYVAYPKAFGVLTHVYDDIPFDNIDGISFVDTSGNLSSTAVDHTFTLADGSTTELYYVYRWILASSGDDFPLTFTTA